MLNELQEDAYAAFYRHENLFLTGSAGTGTSHVLQEIYKAAQRKGLKVGMTATTGSASHLVGGRTIHSFLGIGLGKGTAAQLAMATVNKNKGLVKKLKVLDALVIEEVSMLDEELFDKISDYLSSIRQNTKPFGGLQLFVLGDFCQLPPINKSGTGPKFCFKSNIWASLKFTTVQLVTLVRQHEDPVLQGILEKVRWGKCDKETLKILRGWMTKEDSDESDDEDADTTVNQVQPTRLYPMNINVDTINDAAYRRLIADDNVKKATYDTKYSSPMSKSWAMSSKIPEHVKLCVGAQVVVTWNVNQALGVVNGSRGIIVDIDPAGVHIRDVSGRLIIIDMITITSDYNLAVTYMPLRLAYALTIHRCQGMTLDSVIIDLGSSIFEYGQAYTALSRVRDINSIKLVGVEASSFKCHPDVIAFYQGMI